MKILDYIQIELDYLDDEGRQLVHGVYAGDHNGLHLSNDKAIDCTIHIQETSNGFDYYICDVKKFDESGLEVMEFDEEKIKQLIINKIIFI